MDVSEREAAIAQLLHDGEPPKRIARSVGLSPSSVYKAMHRLAGRLPGHGAPVVKIVRWWSCQNSSLPSPLHKGD